MRGILKVRKGFLWCILVFGIACNAGLQGQEGALDPERIANTIVLDEAGVTNLGIETVVVLEESFEQTVFALGRIEAIPSKHGVVSSRIAGRVVELKAHEGDRVAAGDTIAIVESRQPGNPPPRVELKAPLSGLVTESHVKIGEPVDPSNEILDVIDLSEVYAIARVPEDQAAQLKPGTLAHIAVPALGNERFEGEMIRFGTTADRESGTLDAVFLLPNPSGRLRPDMRAEFSVVLGKRENVMAVPRSSLQGDPASRLVYVRDLDIPNAFVKAPVQTGEQNDRYVEILSGLFPGDEVVVKGAYMLSFAGSGSISLKEALDAAHGHEHNEDGSEMTAAQKAQKEREKAEANGEGSGAGNYGHLTPYLIGSNLLLLALLVLVGFKKLHPASEAEPAKEEAKGDA